MNKVDYIVSRFCEFFSVCIIFFSFFNQGLFTYKANARSLESGKIVFENNCNVCHVGGKNIIIPEKNLGKKSLEANGMNNLDAIVYQVTNGKNGMPAFGGRLNETQIEQVSSYVLNEFGKRTEN